MRRRAWPAALAALAAAALGSAGCTNLGYYGQAIGGHFELMRKARPVADWLADPGTPAPLRARLELAQRMRDFASRELGLPDNSSYRRYAALGRSAVVWNIVATPELSLELERWCFPVMGCVGYRGYFDQTAANAFADGLRARGLDVNVYGVPAYSTLGWSNLLGGDPLLDTFVQWDEAELARLIFHELAHQVAYAADDTAFNESFATAVERLGAARWQAARHAGQPAPHEDRVKRWDRVRADFRALTQAQRARLAAVYAGPDPDEVKRVRKAEAMAAFRAEYEVLKRERWNGYAGYDDWVARANNASFAVQAAYHEGVPAFEALFEREGRDFKRFYAAVQRLAEQPAAERRAALAALAPARTVP